MLSKLFSAQYFHLIGIGGSGLSGLARLLKQMGKNVSGSDEKASSTTIALEKEGFSITIGHHSQNVPAKTDFIIYSYAIPVSNPERFEATERGISQLSYPEAIGVLTNHKQTIAICGTHGKTTTTAMTAAALLASGKDPTVIVGAAVPELQNRNERLGESEYFVLEACEYRRAFLNYQPKIIVLTNIEADHLDYYRDLEDYKNAFQQFLQKLPPDGLVIANNDDENVRSICKAVNNIRIVWFGKSDQAHYRLQNSRIWKKAEQLAELNLSIPGEHNLMNATAAFAVADQLQADLTQTVAALNQYGGVSRRFEYKGRIGQTQIYDDYAHHPTEIKATLQAARQKFGIQAKILCIFQPHQYSRTYKLLEDFAASFKDASAVIVPNILQVRDSAADLEHIDPQTFVKKINDQGVKATFGHSLEKTTELVRKIAANFDVIMTMGAGDVWKISEELKKIIDAKF